jgi:ribosomal protein L3 glutamine methyltransferase
VSVSVNCPNGSDFGGVFFMLELNDKTTIRQSIEQIAELFEKHPLFYGHGTDNAWDEAVALVLGVLGLAYDVSEAALSQPLAKKAQARLIAQVKKRIIDKIPVPYLTQTAYFAGHAFYIDERALIPRSPIAELIEQQFYPWINPEKVTRILDMCTGGGCLAIASALAFPEACVDAADISQDALCVAEINVDRYHLQDRLKLYCSDLFKRLPPARYDIIISNPPYVNDQDFEEMPAEFKQEPALALHAEDQGLALAIEIMNKAPDYLSEEGILIVEVGNSAPALNERFPAVPFIWLEFERGGDGVFLLTAKDLNKLRRAVEGVVP